MADLTAAVTALQALAGDDVEVAGDGNTTRIVIRYLDTAPTGSISQEKASYEFTAQAGPGGAVVSSFDSRPWETSIRARVEDAGWTRKKGLMGKLFGR